VLLSAVLFYINEAIKFKIKTPYLGYLFRSHYNDFWGGVSFIALVNIILYFSIYNKIKNFKIILVFALLCSVFWEVVTPVFVSSSVGDFWDVIAYSLGFTTYWIIKRYINKDKTYNI